MSKSVSRARRKTTSRKLSARSHDVPAPSLICEACGAENDPRASACSNCGKTRFAPKWVRQLKRINRSFAVQVTDSHPLSGDPHHVLTLYKWWPGGRASFNILTAAQWEAVQRAVDELAPFLKWRTRKELAKALEDRREGEASLDAALAKLGKDDPSVLEKLIGGLDFGAISPEDLSDVAGTLSSLAAVLVGADARMREAIERVVKKLPTQGAAALESLSGLMEQLTLGQITAVTAEVQRRVNLLELFKQRLHDERTYEIRGEGSIHRLLERAMWIVNEHYWLMHSNETLRTIVGNELAKKDKRHGSKRPDFVCGSVDKKLIIIEIKRPSHVLDVKDLNQLEQYVVLCDRHDTDHTSAEAYLVGKRASDDLRGALKYRRGLQLRTYTDLAADTERRYKDYLAALGKPVIA
jgi:ribosomal protein L40E